MHCEYSVFLMSQDMRESIADVRDRAVIWIVMTVLSAVALVSSCWTQHYDLDRPLETDHGFREAEKAMSVEDGVAS